MDEAIELIKGVFKAKNTDKIRYGDIEHIFNHHEALKVMEEEFLVTTYFHGYKVYIEKNGEW